MGQFYSAKRRFLRPLILLSLSLGAGWPAASQVDSGPYWLAGRYDGSKVIVYFGAVKFGGNNLPSSAERMDIPVTRFFSPFKLPADSISALQRRFKTEPFAVGGQYDILGGTGSGSITLQTLAGAINDEEVGNDSYIGALASFDDEGGMAGPNYFVVTRHRTQPVAVSPKARLLSEPVPFDLERQIATLLIEHAGRARPEFAKVSPAFTVQCFLLADGSRRFYVRAEWTLSSDKTYFEGAWFAADPELRLLATEPPTSQNGFEASLPVLHNAVSLNDKQTGLIVEIQGEDSFSIDLREYRDGVPLVKMRRLNGIAFGE